MTHFPDICSNQYSVFIHATSKRKRIKSKTLKRPLPQKLTTKLATDWPFKG
jgi:hypothetical protein